MKFNKEELQLLSDGLDDTLIRLKEGQIEEDYETYTSKVIILKRKIEKELEKEEWKKQLITNTKDKIVKWNE